VSDPTFLTINEVVSRYRNQVSEGTLRNWRSMRVGPSFVKLGKAVLYPLVELEAWDRRNLVVCRPTRELPVWESAFATQRFSDRNAGHVQQSQHSESVLERVRVGSAKHGRG
jgi:hypothetical protein